jgi:hypothetical protein
MSMEMSFFTPARQGARVCLFLLMPYNKCIGVIPIVGMCQAEHCPHKLIRPSCSPSRLLGSCEAHD